MPRMPRTPTTPGARSLPTATPPAGPEADAMRILLVGNHWTAGPGGAETVLVLTGELLAARGHPVLPLAVDEAEALTGVTRDRFPRPAGARARTRAGEAVAGLWSPRAFVALDRLVRDLRPDVAHVHHVHERLTLSVLDALRRRGVPTVMTLHDYKAVCPGYRLYAAGRPGPSCLPSRYAEVLRHRCLEGSWWRSAAAAADGYLGRARGVYDGVGLLLAPSRFLRDRLVDGGLPPDRLRLLVNPVRSTPLLAEQPPGPAYVLYAGRLVAEKGVLTLLDAAARFPPGLRLRLGGTGRLLARGRARGGPGGAAPPSPRAGRGGGPAGGRPRRDRSGRRGRPPAGCHGRRPAGAVV